jgi:hypothetical protein
MVPSPASLWRAIALPDDATSPRKRGEVRPVAGIPDGTWLPIAVEPKSATNPEINSCHIIRPLREITSATSFQLRQESYIIVSIEFALRESAPEEQREKTRGEKRERRNGSSPTHAYLYAFSNHHRNGLHQMQRADETRIDRAAGRTVQPRHVSLQRMRGGREFPEGDLTLIVFFKARSF